MILYAWEKKKRSISLETMLDDTVNLCDWDLPKLC